MDNPRFCQHCGAKLGKEAKFCQKCGYSVGETVRKRMSWGVAFFIISIALSVLGGLMLQTATNPNDQAVAGVILFIAGIFYIGAVIQFLKWLFKKNRYAFWIAITVFVIIPILSIISYQSSRLYLRQIFEIQEIAAEVVYAKSIGDDLIQGRAVSGTDLDEKSVLTVYADEKITTWPQINSKVTREYTRLKGKKVRKEVEPYRVSVGKWTAQVVEALDIQNPQLFTTEEINRWNGLPQIPETAAFNLDNAQAVKTLDTLSSHVLALRDVGDGALISDDKDTMRRVAAHALTQSHVVEGIAAKAANICSKRGCVSEVRNFIPAVHRTAYDYLAGSPAARDNWDNTWKDAPEIINGAGAPLGGTGINQGAIEPTIPPNPSTTIRKVTPFQWPWIRPQPQIVSWDGAYTTSANINCDAQSGDYGSSIADSVVGDFEVRGGKIIGGGVEISIDDNGYAYSSVEIEGISASANYYFVQTADGGVSFSGDLSVSGGAEDATVSCTGDFSGYRTSP